MTKKNPQTPSEQRDAIISKMDTNQLNHSSNRVSVTKELDDSPSVFVKGLGSNLSLNEEFIKFESTPDVYSECTRFSRPVKKIEIEKD